jgi:NADH dehydrogenase
MVKAADRILIVGGGFAGVTLAQRLEWVLPPTVEIFVVSEENHFVFTPMLPEVVGRTISPLHVVVAGRTLTRRTRWLKARITRVDRENNRVFYQWDSGATASSSYTHLVLACGSEVDLSLVPGLAARGYPLKTVMDAIVLGNDLIANFETAAIEAAADERRRLLTAVVVGGGFSGVEVGGHIADLMRAIHRYYPELAEERPRVVILQRRERLLPELNHEALSEFALRKLRQNGVEVRLNTTAQSVNPRSVIPDAGGEIECGTVVSTVGTTTRRFIRELDLPLEHGRLKTSSDMRVWGTENPWAIGDCAWVPNAHDGKPSPETAQFAVQQARQLARNLGRALTGRPTKPFSYRPRGLLASIGHRNAVAEIYGIQISGFLAWFLWRGIYLAKLPTFGRKLEVAVDWAWSLLFPPNLVQLRPHRSGFPGARPPARFPAATTPRRAHDYQSHR